ncbi:unnamed protein product, partial [marine sediment metagenome]
NGHKVYTGDLHKLPFENASFDAIYCRHTFEHVLYPHQALSEFHRVLKTGGVIFIIVPKTSLSGSHVQKISSPNSITKHCEKLKFRILNVKTVCGVAEEFWISAEKPVDLNLTASLCTVNNASK